MKFTFSSFLIIISCLVARAQLPEGFVNMLNEIPSIKVELRYYSSNNFVGKKIDGYNSNQIILTKQATDALKIIQNKLEKKHLSLKIYDGYRPQQAVNYFWNWAKNVHDTLMKAQYYPNVQKKNLFKEQYIASKSRHSSGSTIDVTLVDILTNKELDMGSPFDFFGESSWVNYAGLTQKQKENRGLLQLIMKNHGFSNYPKEWWHFTLVNEPFKGVQFDFLIE
jgi:D-alanyl-D-alanine dipeptidase